MAEDAILKYQNTIKMNQFHLFKLSTHEKRIIAEMLIPEIRNDLKAHHKETYKRDRRIYKQIIANKNICIEDNTIELLRGKFNNLINDKPILERGNCKLVV